MIRMVPHRSVKMREEDLQENIGRNGCFSRDELLRFKKFLQMVQGRDDLVPHRQDKVLPDDEIYLLILCFAAVRAGCWEMEHQERRVSIARHERCRGRGEQFRFKTPADGE